MYKRQVIYCDPPYAGFYSYTTGAWDADRFWRIVAAWSKECLVLVSEHDAPSDFVAFRECATFTSQLTSMRKEGLKCNARVERLYVHRSRAKYVR